MSAGNITRRGARSWRLKFEAGERDPLTGNRRTRFVTVRGTKKDAQAELIRLLSEVQNGTAVEPSKVTIADYLRGWLASDRELAPKTIERYRQLVERQIIPHLGGTPLQKLRPAQVHDWHDAIAKAGGKEGRALSARTVGHAHRVLHRAYERALRLEIVSRNPVHAVPPPKPDAAEIEILSHDQVGTVLDALRLSLQRPGQNFEPGPHPLYAIVATALGTGLRRGELCGLAWGAVDLDAATLRVERSLEETAAGLRFKQPKTKHGYRTVSLPAPAVDALRAHRRQQLEFRLVVGLGRLGPEDLVFGLPPEGMPYPPDKLSRDWGNVVRDKKLPRIMFHALRHTHASALIAAGIDIVTISRRLGHGSPAITLSVYAHLFNNTDAAAAAAIEAALLPRR